MTENNNITLKDIEKTFTESLHTYYIGLNFKQTKTKQLSDLIDLSIKAFVSFNNKELLLKLLFPNNSKTRIWSECKEYFEYTKFFLTYYPKDNKLLIDISEYEKNSISYFEYMEKGKKDKKKVLKEKDKAYFEKALNKLERQELDSLFTAFQEYLKNKNIILKQYSLIDFDSDNITNIEQAEKELEKEYQDRKKQAIDIAKKNIIEKKKSE